MGFPLAVKLNLASVGLYDIATHDRGRCEAVDRLLIEPGWRDRILEGDWAGRSMWHMTVGRTCDRVKWAAALESIQRATQEGSQETAE